MTRASLPEELHLEILKCLSPSPQVLARASAVCREWRRVVNDPGFLRELYRGAPVTLGFFHNFDHLPRRFVHMDEGDPVRIDFEPIDRMIYSRFLDCRHGRVLLHDKWRRFVVWHPITGDHHILQNRGPVDIEHNSAALICDCAADGSGDGSKLGQCTPCHASHFRVAVVFNHSRSGCLQGTVFSSLTGRWTSWAELAISYQICPEHCVIVGKTLYQTLSNYLVLAFDTDQRSLTAFKRPNWGNVRLLKVEGSALGLAGVLGFTLRLWVRYADAWVMRKTVVLSDILPRLSTPSDPRFTLMPPVKIIGVADWGDELVLWTMVGIFMLCVESMELKKVKETTHDMKTVYPYATFYLPPSALTKRLQLSSRVLDMFTSYVH